jgi:hypothetical protein
MVFVMDAASCLDSYHPKNGQIDINIFGDEISQKVIADAYRSGMRFA